VGQEVAILGQTAPIHFRQKSLLLLEISILPLNSSKMVDFQLQIRILEETLPTNERVTVWLWRTPRRSTVQLTLRHFTLSCQCTVAIVIVAVFLCFLLSCDDSDSYFVGYFAT